MQGWVCYVPCLQIAQSIVENNNMQRKIVIRTLNIIMSLKDSVVVFKKGDGQSYLIDQGSVQRQGNILHESSLRLFPGNPIIQNMRKSLVNAVSHSFSSSPLREVGIFSPHCERFSNMTLSWQPYLGELWSKTNKKPAWPQFIPARRNPHPMPDQWRSRRAKSLPTLMWANSGGPAQLKSSLWRGSKSH